jgi:uncharacterized protein
VKDGSLVVESKGIYSIEKFIIARRLMYWQVYLHKTVLSAEQMLLKILERAREVALQGEKLFATPALAYFLERHISADDFATGPEVLEQYMALDDYDVFASIKAWIHSNDKVLATLCRMLVERKLFRVRLQNEAIPPGEVADLRSSAAAYYGISEDDAAYFVLTDSTSNHAYNTAADKIKILYRDGTTLDIAEASDQLNIRMLSQPVVKHYLCYPKTLTQH